MAEANNLPQSYNPEEANRQLRSLLESTLQKAQRGGWWLIATQLTVAAATVVLMIFNGITVGLTFKQIAAVRASIEESQRQFNLSQRPWVASTKFVLTNIEVGKKPHALVRTVNRGLTPAVVKTRIYLRIRPELPKEFSYPDVPFVSSAILLPNTWGEVFIDHNTELSEQMKTAIDNEQMMLYAYGYSEYEDPRGNTYRTNFCVFWNPRKHSQSFCACVFRSKPGSWPFFVNVTNVSRFQLIRDPTLARFPRFPLNFVSTLIDLPTI